MTSIEITLDDFELEGWPFTTWLGRRLNKVQGDGYHGVHLQFLKESNPSAYNHARRLIRGAVWKTRASKFKRYRDNIAKYLEDCAYV